MTRKTCALVFVLTVLFVLPATAAGPTPSRQWDRSVSLWTWAEELWSSLRDRGEAWLTGIDANLDLNDSTAGADRGGLLDPDGNPSDR